LLLSRQFLVRLVNFAQFRMQDPQISPLLRCCTNSNNCLCCPLRQGKVNNYWVGWTVHIRIYIRHSKIMWENYFCLACSDVENFISGARILILNFAWFWSLLGQVVQLSFETRRICRLRR
jgi:hypothetical protein